MSAEEFARAKHAGQKYGDQDYGVHLGAVVQVLIDSGFTDPDLLAAGWLHDVLEDTDATYDDLAGRFGLTVAELVFACTGVGKNRRERNACIAERIERNPAAAPLKLADRIANVEASRGTAFMGMYRAEMLAFENTIRRHAPEDMWQRLVRAVAP